MGYAIIYGSIRVLEAMLNCAINPYQKGLIMEETRAEKIDRRMQEINCIALFWMALQSGLFKTSFRMMSILIENNVDLSKTFDLRTQHTINNEVIKHSLSVYGDFIHFLKHQFKDTQNENEDFFTELNFYVDVLDKMRSSSIDLESALNSHFEGKKA